MKSCPILTANEKKKKKREVKRVCSQLLTLMPPGGSRDRLPANQKPLYGRLAHVFEAERSLSHSFCWSVGCVDATWGGPTRGDPTRGDSNKGSPKKIFLRDPSPASHRLMTKGNIFIPLWGTKQSYDYNLRIFSDQELRCLLLGWKVIMLWL